MDIRSLQRRVIQKIASTVIIASSSMVFASGRLPAKRTSER